MVSRQLLAFALIGGGILALTQLGGAEKLSGGGGGTILSFLAPFETTDSKKLSGAETSAIPSIPSLTIQEASITSPQFSQPPTETKKTISGVGTLSPKGFYSETGQLIGVEDPIAQQSRLPTPAEKLTNIPTLQFPQSTTKKQPEKSFWSNFLSPSRYGFNF